MRADLPLPESLSEFGYGKHREIRSLYAEGCNVDEIAVYLGLAPIYVSRAIRYQRRHRVICEKMKSRWTCVKPAESVVIDSSAMRVAYEGPMRCGI